jgi:hypothetical protein
MLGKRQNESRVEELLIFLESDKSEIRMLIFLVPEDDYSFLTKTRPSVFR